MKDPATDQILDLTANLLLPFHQIKRQHKLPIGRRRRENDVEHSWTVAVLACALAPHMSSALDIGRISQFALVHDLVEVFAGDTSHFSASEPFKASKKEREHAAYERIRTDFHMFPWLSRTIAEYETLASEEAAFVYAVDKYIAVIYDLLDKGFYLQQIGIDRSTYDALMDVHRIKAHRHSRIGEYYDEVRKLIDQQPEFLSPQF